MNGGHRVLENLKSAGSDTKLQRYLKSEVTKLIKDLKL